MSYIKITNNGEIDINALTLLGASSKAGDADKIGFFGSGNKYALATFLRNGIGVRIFSGDKEFVVATEHVDFRGQTFDRITIDRVQTSLTTRTGPEWKLWMALRELLCNAIDEGGEYWEEVDCVSAPGHGTTAIFLEENDELSSIYEDLDSIVINDIPRDEIETRYGKIAIYDRQAGRVYRKGICCSDEFSKSLFSYSFDQIEINESRIVPYDSLIYERITTVLAATKDPVIVDKIATAMLLAGKGDDILEGDILRGGYWSSAYCYSALSPAWRDWFLATKKVCCPVSCLVLMPPEDAATVLALPDGFYDKLTTEWPEIPHVGEGGTEWIPAEEPLELSRKVNCALAELKTLGLCGDRDYTIKWVSFVCEQTVMATDGCESPFILVSAKERADVNYTAGLLEEVVHKTTGLGDGSRNLQTLLFDRWLAAERRAARNDAFVALIENACAMRR